MSDEDLGDALVAGEIENGGDGVFGFKDVNFGSQLPGIVEVILESLFGFARKFACFDG